MSSFVLYHTNAIDTAALAGGSWQPNLPLTNLYSPSTTKRARSTNATLASTQFTVNLAEAVTARGIQIIATNLSAAGLYRITWYTDQTYTAAVDSTGWIPIGSSIDWTDVGEWFDWLDPDFWLGAQPIVDPDNRGIDIRYTFAEPTAVQYLKIEFDDQTNADAFIEVGHVFIGRAFIPTFNVGPEPTFQRISLTAVKDAIGGGQYFSRRGSRKRLSVVWPMMPREESLDELDEIIRIQDIDRPVYVDLDPENLGSGRNTAFLARIQTMPETRLLDAYLEGDTGSTVGFEFHEVI